MNLIVDANILVRCATGGRAAEQATAAVSRGLVLTTTLAQLDETMHVFRKIFHFDQPTATAELVGVADMMTVVGPEVYQHLEQAAKSRLRWKRQKGWDWAVLASALALRAGIWSDDRDFSGTGVAVWSSPNIAKAGT